MNVLQNIGNSQREIACKPENRVKQITKLESGDMRVEFHNGTSGTLPATDPIIQAFVIWSVLYEA